MVPFGLSSLASVLSPGSVEEPAVFTLRSLPLAQEENGLSLPVQMLAHDLLGSLGFARGVVAHVQESAAARLDPREFALLASAIDGMASLETMVGSLLDLERLQSEEIEAEPSTQDLLRLVREATEELRELEGSERLQLKLRNVPCFAECDASLTRRVIANLVRNALAHTAAPGRVWITLSREPQNLRVCVWDTGSGIPLEEHRAIFTCHQQVGRPRWGRGHGLGLAFCKMAVLAQQGTIGLESGPGYGSCFWFTLPRSF